MPASFHSYHHFEPSQTHPRFLSQQICYEPCLSTRGKRVRRGRLGSSPHTVVRDPSISRVTYERCSTRHRRQTPCRTLHSCSRDRRSLQSNPPCWTGLRSTRESSSLPQAHEALRRSASTHDASHYIDASIS